MPCVRALGPQGWQDWPARLKGSGSAAQLQGRRSSQLQLRGQRPRPGSRPHPRSACWWLQFLDSRRLSAPSVQTEAPQTHPALPPTTLRCAKHGGGRPRAWAATLRSPGRRPLPCAHRTWAPRNESLHRKIPAPRLPQSLSGEFQGRLIVAASQGCCGDAGGVPHLGASSGMFQRCSGRAPLAERPLLVGTTCSRRVLGRVPYAKPTCSPGPGLTLPFNRRGPLDGRRLKLWVSLGPRGRTPREGSVLTESHTLGPNWPDLCPHPTQPRFHLLRAGSWLGSTGTLAPARPLLKAPRRLHQLLK